MAIRKTVLNFVLLPLVIAAAGNLSNGEDCELAILEIINGGIVNPLVNHTAVPERISNMIAYSGKGTNDMGDYEGC
jgi:hypothetical protein